MDPMFPDEVEGVVVVPELPVVGVVLPDIPGIDAMFPDEVVGVVVVLVPGLVVPGEELPSEVEAALPGIPMCALAGDARAPAPFGGCDAASVSDVAPSTSTAAVAIDAAPAHHNLPAVPISAHR
jgi:hypothetical protein